MVFTIEPETTIISNGSVTCYSNRLVIHFYYIPFGNKTVYYRDIKSCELLQLRDLGFLKYRTWGMALSTIWWHSDLHRQWRKYYILLDIEQWPKIGITMDDKDITQVYQLIKQNMNKINRWIFY